MFYWGVGVSQAFPMELACFPTGSNKFSPGVSSVFCYPVRFPRDVSNIFLPAASGMFP